MTTKWWVLAFTQVWMWPQVFDAKMPANIALPLAITMVACFIFNVIKLISAYDRGEY